MKIRMVLFLGIFAWALRPGWSGTIPVRYAIVGLTHDHARGFIPCASSRQDVQLVGIADPNKELRERFARDYKLTTNLFFASAEQMLDQLKPQAVATFTSTFEHMKVVQMCASRGIHVMMEKPLAVSMEHARAIESAAKQGGIQIMVNYETTWYPANHAAYELIQKKNALGELRKIVVHDGHQGPKEIGCSAAFLEWLTDPVLNGGGALTDFGCYGADLITWLMNGERPTSVFAVTQQIKPQIYPKVDDEATIVLTYPRAQGIIQASWNWPFNRKDMEIYGRTGQVLTVAQNGLRVRLAGKQEEVRQAPGLVSPEDDFLHYFSAVVRGAIQPSGLSSLRNNRIVVEILDAARRSAASGAVVRL